MNEIEAGSIAGRRSSAGATSWATSTVILMRGLFIAAVAAAAAAAPASNATRRLQAGSCQSYYEVNAAVQTVEAACCPEGSSFALAGCQMTRDMECTKECSTPFLDFCNSEACSRSSCLPTPALCRPLTSTAVCVCERRPVPQRDPALPRGAGQLRGLRPEVRQAVDVPAGAARGQARRRSWDMRSVRGGPSAPARRIALARAGRPRYPRVRRGRAVRTLDPPRPAPPRSPPPG
eukprot:COSAG04_NODE_138_length_23662_cov_13.997029_11_plen_234_part_00